MAKSNGIKSLKQAAKLLNKHSPDGESLAYINPREHRLLKASGGSGIMTLAGIPSYNENFFTKYIWDPVTSAVGWVGENILGYGKQKVLDKNKELVEVAGRSPFQDAISVYAFLRAKKDQEGLNSAEQSEFNRLNQQLTAGREEVKEYTDEGKQLIAPEYVTTPKAVFSETTGRPDMITTPRAQGGRIGAFNGGIQGLMPQQGFMPQPGLDPRMGYAAQGGRIGLQDSYEGTVGYAQLREKMKHYAEIAGSDNIYALIETATEAGDADFVNQLRKNFTFEGFEGVEDPGFSTASGALGAAQGGRIGAQGGGIMPLLDMGGMEKDYRQDGGFVPIGRKEKADDVPARLSKNEFVFTADAVKAAGGGDIDEGAQRMYNVMKNLEAGGEISQQSQGKA